MAAELNALLIEDSPTQAMHIRAVLEEAGLHVVNAFDGATGLHAAQDQHPDLIVLDVQLPDINGFQVCHALKSDPRTAPIPVIMLTTLDAPENVVSGLEEGVVDYIPKDAFADTVLLETLKQMGLIRP